MKREKIYFEETHKAGELSIAAVGKPVNLTIIDEIKLIVGIPKPIRDFATHEMTVPRYFDIQICFLNQARNESIIVLAVGIPNTESTFTISQKLIQGSVDSLSAEWITIDCDVEVAIRLIVSGEE